MPPSSARRYSERVQRVIGALTAADSAPARPAVELAAGPRLRPRRRVGRRRARRPDRERLRHLGRRPSRPGPSYVGARPPPPPPTDPRAVPDLVRRGLRSPSTSARRPTQRRAADRRGPGQAGPGRTSADSMPPGGCAPCAGHWPSWRPGPPSGLGDLLRVIVTEPGRAGLADDRSCTCSPTRSRCGSSAPTPRPRTTAR